MAKRAEQYTCTIDRDEDGRIAAITIDATDLEAKERSVRLNGNKASRVAAAVHDVLREAGVKGRSWSSSRPIGLSPVPGAHTELLLAAVRPLRRADRIDMVAEGIARMSQEEASYWHAKTRQPGGLRALRVLLTHGAM